MATNNIINFDFDVLKNDIIEYLKSNQNFNSANFEGTGLNIMADVLAYINYMTNITANISANEMFLDTAQLRASVISKAKELGYVPRSITAPRARLLLEFTVDSESDNTAENFTIPKGTKFLSNDHTVFNTIDTYVVEFEHQGNDVYIGRKEIDVYEGLLKTYQYEVTSNTKSNRFLIPTETADISTLKVFVRETITSQDIEYRENDNINILTPSDRIYFKHLNPDGYYEIVFGDGILGKPLVEGNIVSLEYIIVQQGAAMNGATYFTKAQNIGGFNKYKITCLQGAVNGDEEESIESIKYFAPKFYKMQNRAVVKDDYETILKHEYPWIASLTIWGGQDQVPPQYGKIFFAIRSKYVDILSPTIKHRIENDLIEKYNVVTVMPKVVDPDYIYIGTNTRVNYNPDRMNVSLEELKEIVKLGIETYFAEYLEDFNRPFFLSPLTTVIDSLNENNVSSITDIFISKRISLELETKNELEASFHNKIKKETIKSSYFGYGYQDDHTLAYLADNGVGNLNIYSKETGELLEPYAGVIDYESGDMSFTIKPFDLPEELFFTIYAIPDVVDIKSKNNCIIMKDKFITNDYWGLRQGTTITLNPVEIPRD